MSRLLAFVSAAAALLATPVMAQSVDRVAINGIIDQGLNHSQVMQTAAYLTDRIGGRMTNSPQMREAERWAQQQFRDYGLSDVRAEGFEFGRGWSIVRASARMTAPRPLDLRAIPVAWTPGTNGTISAGVIVAPLSKVEDFDKWRGKLSGKIVMISQPGTGSEPTEPGFRRWTSAELAERNTYNQPQYSPAAIRKSLETADFASKLDAFLVEQGALAWVRISQRDGGLLHGTGYTYQVGATPKLAGMELAAEDYRRLARLALTDAPPTLCPTTPLRPDARSSRYMRSFTIALGFAVSLKSEYISSTTISVANSVTVATDGVATRSKRPEAWNARATASVIMSLGAQRKPL